MSKLETLIANGEITIEDLADASELIERAEFVANGIEACKKSLVFPLDFNEIQCYSYTDTAGEYQSWGYCTKDGTFTCYCNWGGNHEIGKCNLGNFSDVFLAFNNTAFVNDLSRFLLQQIAQAN